jgi:hypothetical protein
MFKDLNKKIPPNKALLSYEHLIVYQHDVKGPHYRPEYAWYLDREITQARTIEQIQNFAQTGNYPYYLMPYVEQLAPLINQLRQRYKYELVAGQNGEADTKGRTLRAGMLSYIIFDLTTPAQGG